MMETATSPLVLTKLRAPAARLRLVSRAHLVQRLTPEKGARFLLVCAPAGYGKTTLLAEWAQSLTERGMAIAWYSLDPGDDDPIPFASYLINSLLQALGPIPELAQVAQLLQSSPETELQRILPAVINAILASGRECVLILDDYHLIGSPAIHTAIAYLLEHLPENLRIAIGSRSDPPLLLARLRAGGELLEIRANDLQFTEDQAVQFLNEVMRLELSPEGIAALEERTEGWVAGLQLAALSLSGRADKERFIAAFSGSHRYLVEYLLDEVVDRQREEVSSFLLATSILERMCAQLCEAITENGKELLSAEGLPEVGSQPFGSSSQFILEYLDSSNLFLIPLDDERRWYRYHHLFRDFLQDRLRRTQPERINALHRAACVWLAAHGSLREAAKHAFQTQDWEYAAAFVEQHSFTMLIHSEISTIYEWCSAFPEEVMQKHPSLCIHQCWALVFRFRRQNRDRVEARLRQAEQATAALQDQQQVRQLKESVAIVRTFLAMAPDPAVDPHAQLGIAQNLLGYYSAEDAGRFSALLTSGYAYLALLDGRAANQVFETAQQIALGGRFYFGVVESTFHLARLAHCQGNLRRSAEICRQGQAEIAALLPGAEQELPALGCLDIALGCVLLELDQCEEAEQRLLHGLELIGWSMNPYYLLVAYTALARLREIQGRPAEADGFLQRLEETWPDIAFCTRALRNSLVLRSRPEDAGARAEVATWHQAFSALLNEDAPPPGMGPMGAAEAYYQAYLAWMRAQIAAGNVQAAWSTLERQLGAAEAHGLTQRVIELSLLEGQAWRVQGEDERARAALERALSLAEPEGYIRVFVEEGKEMQFLIEDLRLKIGKSDLHRLTYLQKILDAFPVSIQTPPSSQLKIKNENLKIVEPLSERELELLRLMAGGATNQEIAGQLFITVGTVKSHINHILGKLDAHNRTEAVARARGLGLLKI